MAENEALFQRILADPGETALRLAYADWLASAGDPGRAEFIRVQCELEKLIPEDAAFPGLKERERQLLDKHRDEWLGSLVRPGVEGCGRRADDRDLLTYFYPDRVDTFQFRRGWVDRAIVSRLTDPDADHLGRAPEIRLVRDLQIHGLRLPPYGSNQPPASTEVFARLATSTHFQRVEVLKLGCAEWDAFGYAPVYGKDIPTFVGGLPRLKTFYLFDFDCDFAKVFALPSYEHLEVLRVYAVWSTPLPLDALAANPALGRLTELYVAPKVAAMGLEPPLVTLAAVRALVHSPHLPALRKLALNCASLGAEGCRAIAASGLLKRLKVLQLQHCQLDDTALQILARCPDTRRLALLDLQLYDEAGRDVADGALADSYTEEGVKALLAAGVKVKHYLGEIA